MSTRMGKKMTVHPLKARLERCRVLTYDSIKFLLLLL